MRSVRSFLVAPVLLGWVAALGFIACGSPSGESGGGEAGAGGEAARAAEVGAAGGAGGDAGDAGGGGVPADSLVGGAGGEGGDVHAAGGEGGAASGVLCDKTALDLPDDEFQDTNCDGIDGDAAHAVFVSLAGEDAAAGTLSSPVRTLNHALALAAANKFAVYVCNGTYLENVAITKGARVYGGYDCARGWVRVKDRAVVQGELGLALTIDSVSDAVVIDRLAFRASPARQYFSGESSQAGAINNSSEVSLSHVEFVAQNATPGVKGTAGTSRGPTSGFSGGRGGDTVIQDICDVYAVKGACTTNAKGGFGIGTTCDFNGGKWDLEGGVGGVGANWWVDQGKPACLAGSEPGPLGSFGRMRLPGQDWVRLRTGGAGTGGLNGKDGAGASAGVGSLRGAVYSATNNGADGTWGEPGTPGSGGAGGPSKAGSGDLNCYETFKPGSGGGQGGLGGCGGSPGIAGGGGGGSLGLVVVNSRVTLTWVSITTGKGGDGGAGAVGGEGQPGSEGGVAGDSLPSFRGQDGARGGDGGMGGASGPGGGGPSIGILYVGTAPQVTEGSFDIGVPGSGGALAGGGVAPVGVTGELYQLPQ